MNAVDGSDHYSKTSEGKSSPLRTTQIDTNIRTTTEPPPSLLTIILDTNPHAWALLAPTLSFSSAIANLLVFIDAHLAFNNANKVAIIASHTQRAEFLYPLPEPKTPPHTNGTASPSADGDTEMADAFPPTSPPSNDANHYRPFHHIQTTLLRALTTLLNTTPPSTLTPTTSLAGALTLALTYTNKLTLSLSAPSTNTTTTSQPDQYAAESAPALNARILILSVSGDLARQHIQIMNAIFACQRLRIPIDIAKIAGDTVFLQQASDATHGTYTKLDHPRGLLQYLMMAFLPDQASRRFLVAPTASYVDFRAACFCHRRVVDVGFVCSVCLASR